MAFRTRIEQATAVIQSRSSDAVLLIVIDASDNLGIAADDVSERSFCRRPFEREASKGLPHSGAESNSSHRQVP